MPLYKFHLDCGRMGKLEGVFKAEEYEISKLMGQNVYFGEVLGKHSEISAVISDEVIQKLEADEVFIAKAEEIGLVPCGFDPLCYVCVD